MNIFNKLFREQSEIFLESFGNHSGEIFHSEANRNGLLHAGEFGIYREGIVKNYISSFIPQRLRVESGFVISSEGEVSNQADVVIYDHYETPIIELGKGQIFYPIETTVAVGEIKSDLKKSQLKTALNKLVQYKIMREEIERGYILYTKRPSTIRQLEDGTCITQKSPFDPLNIHSDQLSTFLICKKLDFELDPSSMHEQIKALYPEGTPQKYMVDYILSIDDGFISYYDQNENIFTFEASFSNGKIELLPKDEEHKYLKMFAIALNTKLTFTTIVKPELQKYLKMNYA